MPGSSPVRQTEYTYRGFLSFFSVPPRKYRDSTRISHNCFRSNLPNSSIIEKIDTITSQKLQHNIRGKFGSAVRKAREEFPALIKGCMCVH
jgi:hypothetical protein